MIYMLGFDHTTADMQTREIYAVTETVQRTLLYALKRSVHVSGCAILSTCNRLEIYVSGEQLTREGIWSVIVTLPCIAWKEDAAFSFLQDRAAVQHLMEVSAGLRSQILGEDQIVAQVKQAIACAREEKAADAPLETLFRLAVTAGKAIRSQIQISAVPRSAAETAVHRAEALLGCLAQKRILVIGNGEMGRLACKAFVEKGAQVTVTLRTYRKGETVVPFGCDTIVYDRRYEAVAQSDVVLSATRSPHQTITYDQMCKLPNVPPLLIDLALPRDIDTAASALTTLWDLDDLRTDQLQVMDDVTKAHGIINRYIQDFYAWAAYRQALPEIRAIETAIAEAVQMQMPNRDHSYAAAEKAAHIMLASMKDTLTTDMLQKMLLSLQGKAEREDVS